MANHSKTPVKKKQTKVPAKRSAVKKTVAKKTTSLKKNATIKKKTIRSPRKSSTPVVKATVSKRTTHRGATNAATLKQKIKTVKNKAAVEKIETNRPPVEEPTPVPTFNTSSVAGLDKKSMQRAAARNYDNHHIRLSSVSKRGVKPFVKKAPW